MRCLIAGIALLLSFSMNSSAQAVVGINWNTGTNFESKTEILKGFKTVIAILPERNFSAFKISINGKIFSFDCNTKDGCYPLLASDIDSGRVYFHFNENHLAIIGNRPFLEAKDFLTGKDTMKIWTTGDKLSLAIPFLDKDAGKATAAKKGTDGFNSAFCKDTSSSQKTINPLADFTFLCTKEDQKQQCDCGIPIANKFENIYLPPCYDKHGNAISIKNHILYDMSETDPLQKAFLFKIRRMKKNKLTDEVKNCTALENSKYFQFARIKKQMAPSAGDIMAVSVIAHKDSVIQIDTTYVNHFLDSALAAAKAFTAAGTSKADTAAVPEKITGGNNQAEHYLRGAVTLSGDLIYFNNYYRELNFVQEKYNVALACLQLNIARFFLLGVTPKSGNELAASIEARLLAANLDKTYYHFACELLKLIASEYDAAVNRQSNYRVYTRLIQIPNADEMTVAMKASKSDYFYRHNLNIKGGIKIDFSTAVVLTGLNDREFILRSFRFRVKDSLTGLPRDTTGNLIVANKGKLKYNTGFLVHIYRRSGYFINTGLVTGVTFNNSEFMMTLGASAMFRLGNIRLSLVGGAAFGQRKRLDANHEQYLYDGNAYPLNKEYVQNQTPDRLPRFFTDTNISTYDKLKGSWFAGISFNFASIKL